MRALKLAKYFKPYLLWFGIGLVMVLLLSLILSHYLLDDGFVISLDTVTLSSLGIGVLFLMAGFVISAAESVRKVEIPSNSANGGGLILAGITLLLIGFLL